MDRTARTAGVDVGGTKVAAALLDGTELTVADPVPTEVEDSEALVDQIAEAVGAFGPVDAVGVGVPSVVRLHDGLIVSSTNIAAFRDVPLRRALSDRLGVPVRVDNDANLAALSEAWDDDLELVERHLACVTVGTGIGSGAVIGGHPLHGSRTSAMELGHLIAAANLDRGAPTGGTPPLPESLEHYASGRALDRLAKGAGFDDGRDVADAAVDGNATAVELLRILGERVGVGVAALITLLEPALVVIGGGVSRTGELVVGPAREAAKRLLLPGLGAETEIRTATHGPQAGVRGAAILARLPDAADDRADSAGLPTTTTSSEDR